jgi:hypothetical protein
MERRCGLVTAWVSALGNGRLVRATIEEHQPAGLQPQTSQIAVELRQALVQRVRGTVAPDLEDP